MVATEFSWHLYNRYILAYGNIVLWATPSSQSEWSILRCHMALENKTDPQCELDWLHSWSHYDAKACLIWRCRLPWTSCGLITCFLLRERASLEQRQRRRAAKVCDEIISSERHRSLQPPSLFLLIFFLVASRSSSTRLHCRLIHQMVLRNHNRHQQGRSSGS